MHVTFCYIAFYTVVSWDAQLIPTVEELIAVGGATLVGYNVAKYSHLWRVPFAYKKGILWITGVAAIATLLTVLQLGFYALLLFIGCGLLTTLYILPQLLGRSFRQIPILKLLTIGLSWSLLAVLLPLSVQLNDRLVGGVVLHDHEVDLTMLLIMSIAHYSFMVIAWCIPFEIRDLKYDAPNLGTLPQLIGVKKTKGIGIILLIIAGFLWILLQEYHASNPMVYLTIITISAAGILGAGESRKDYYASFYIEAIPVLWMFLKFVVT